MAIEIILNVSDMVIKCRNKVRVLKNKKKIKHLPEIPNASHFNTETISTSNKNSIKQLSGDDEIVRLDDLITERNILDP